MTSLYIPCNIVETLNEFMHKKKYAKRGGREKSM